MQPLHIASLNLLNFVEPPLACYEWEQIYSAAQWQQKTGWLRALLTAQQPDVLALQEVFSVAALQQLLAPLGYQLWTVQQPVLVDEHLFTAPVVALASRYPLLQLQAIEAEPAAKAALGLADFSFSRTPLLAQLDTPQLGPLWLAVVHLKSKRPAEHPDPVLALWSSELQRGHEAALLHQALAQRCGDQPLVVAGDFNDELNSPLLQPLLVAAGDGHGFALQDAAVLAPAGPRPPTHYHGASGRRLDHLLLSSVFAAAEPAPLASVSAYQVVDRHLVRPDFAVDGYSSDHALVQISLQPQSGRRAGR